jgi:hypothetical protein
MNPAEKKDYPLFRRSQGAWYESCSIASTGNRTKEVDMATMMALTATTVLLSSLFSSVGSGEGVMGRLPFQTGGAFEPWWWIPTVFTRVTRSRRQLNAGK